MGVEIVQHDADLASVREMDVDQLTQTLSEITLGPPLRDFDLPPSQMWGKHHKGIAHAVALVQIVEAGRLSRLSWQGFKDIRQQLTGALIKTHQRLLWVWHLCIQVQDILHPPHEGRIYLWDTPLLVLPGLNFVFSRSGALFHR